MGMYKSAETGLETRATEIRLIYNLLFFCCAHMIGFHDQERADALLDEALYMKNLDHSNILTLIGVCMDEASTPWIVMPYMANGSLLVHLRTHNYVLGDSHDQALVKE